MERNFSESTTGISKLTLVQRFKIKNFDNRQDARHMAVLYFINTFVFSQLHEASVTLEDFKIVEDGCYEYFSWGNLALTNLTDLLR